MEIDGYAIAVTTNDGDALDLDAVVERYGSTTQAPFGFKVNVGADPGELHTIMDRSGLTIARLREREHASAVLRRHLGATLTPPEGTVRLRSQAVLLADGTAALLAFPLGFDPPLVERRLERAGARVIDRIAIDVSSDAMLRMTIDDLFSDSMDVPGHMASPAEITLSRVLIPAGIGAEASLRVYLAELMAGWPDQELRRSVLDSLQSRELHQVPLDESSALYASLN